MYGTLGAGVWALEDGHDVLADGAQAVVQQPLVDALAVVEVQARQRAHFLTFLVVRVAHGAERLVLRVGGRPPALGRRLALLVTERGQRQDLRVRQPLPRLVLRTGTTRQSLQPAKDVC
jgi:hypothetical protein